MAKTILKTTTYNGTWGGRPGTTTTHSLDGRRLGLRIVAHKWDDSDDVEVRLVDGDGRSKAGLREFNNMTVPAAVAEAVVADMAAAA